MVKLKTISLTVKFSPQNRKINYTLDLPSNSILQTENLKRDWAQERAQRENPKKTGNHSCQAQAKQGESTTDDA